MTDVLRPPRFLRGPKSYSVPIAGARTRVRLRHDHVPVPGWPEERSLRIMLIADIHACRPWMMPSRIRRIVEAVQDRSPDLILLLGDYIGDHLLALGRLPADKWVEPLRHLEAPLGVHAILGNHDGWRYDSDGASIAGSTLAQPALERIGIPVYENSAQRLEADGFGIWLAGLGCQSARPSDFSRWRGVDDLDACLDPVTGDDPVVLMAHEPDIFPQVPEHVLLTVSGHTHGGQIRIRGAAPIVPSRFRNRYAYGHVREAGASGVIRHLVVSGGLGCSGLPIRLGVPPELVEVTLKGAG